MRKLRVVVRRLRDLRANAERTPGNANLPLELQRNVERLAALLRKRDVDGVRTWMTRHMVDFRRAWSAAGLDIDSAVDGDTRYRHAL